MMTRKLAYHRPNVISRSAVSNLSPVSLDAIFCYSQKCPVPGSLQLLTANIPFLSRHNRCSIGIPTNQREVKNAEQRLI
jgi:hypothetical protein